MKCCAQMKMIISIIRCCVAASFPICLALHAGAADRSQHCTWDDSIHSADPPSKLRIGSGSQKSCIICPLLLLWQQHLNEKEKELIIMADNNVWCGGNQSQALAEEPPVYPHKFFRTLLDLAFARAK